jgi:hypothetical protein
MADLIPCDNCGAPLAEEDVFCGECGAPRLALRPAAGEASAEPAAIKPSPATRAGPAPSPGLTRPACKPEASWRVAFLALVVVGALACLVGLVTFLLVGFFGDDGTAQAENWQIATLCCLLPFGGMGAILAAAGAAIWYTRLRNR